MENNSNKERNKKTFGKEIAINVAIITSVVGTAFMSAILSDKGFSLDKTEPVQTRYIVEMDEDEPIKEEKVSILSENIITVDDWATYDQDKALYKVDLDKMFSKYIFDDIVVGKGVKKAKNEIISYLGEDIYTEGERGTIYTDNYVLLTNLKDKEITVYPNKDKDGHRSYILEYTDENNNIVRLVGSNNKYYIYTCEKKYPSYRSFDKYCEYYDSCCMAFRREDDILIDISLNNNELSIQTFGGKATYHITDNEKNVLEELIKKYNHSSDMRLFLGESIIDSYIEELRNETKIYKEITEDRESIFNEMIEEKDSKTLIK